MYFDGFWTFHKGKVIQGHYRYCKQERQYLLSSQNLHLVSWLVPVYSKLKQLHNGGRYGCLSSGAGVAA
jgi:hypothetical protein